MNSGYTDERSVQILLTLMKKHNVSKVVVSPGTANISLVGSMQNDSFFQLYSSADERSAAYIACGLAAETNEPVAISCTGATASRNYFPALTEAFYRKLPILAITSALPESRIGQNIPQVLDRRVQPNDTVKISVQVPPVHDKEEEWHCNLRLNEALLELYHGGCGPVHINLVTSFSKSFTTPVLPDTRLINRVTYGNILPNLTSKQVAVFVGSHLTWSNELTAAIERFCELYNGVVICDHTSNYKGNYSVLANLVVGQTQVISELSNIEMLIHIGDISGAYMDVYPSNVWRVNPDGIIRDTFRKLSIVFEMEELAFFKEYIKLKNEESYNDSYYKMWNKSYCGLINKIPDLPFSNIWVAKNTINKLPQNSVVHFGILNSLRSWNFFDTDDKSISWYCNTGGFGIDGCVSTLVGASLANSLKLYFGFVGDLAFFYDMNSLGNRHIKNNLRLLVVNNGKGTEFRNYSHIASALGDEADLYVAAAGHYGNKSEKLLQHYAEDLGFEYFQARNKSEFLQSIDKFTNSEITAKPLLFEVFTNSEEESNALKIINTLTTNASSTVKQLAKNILGEGTISAIKKKIKR